MHIYNVKELSTHCSYAILQTTELRLYFSVSTNKQTFLMNWTEQKLSTV